MIAIPRNVQEWQVLASFMQEYALVSASPDTKFIAWVEAGHVKMIVAFNSFLGQTCQMHVAMMKGYNFTPRKMLEACFDYAFNQLKRSKVLGVVNSKNERAMTYDLHLGFTEEHRLPGMHDDGGDIVLLSMSREQCKYIEHSEAA